MSCHCLSQIIWETQPKTTTGADREPQYTFPKNKPCLVGLKAGNKIEYLLL